MRRFRVVFSNFELSTVPVSLVKNNKRFCSVGEYEHHNNEGVASTSVPLKL